MSHQHIVPKAEYAREWGVAARTVTEWARGWLAPAATEHGIDRNHPVAQKGPAGRDRSPTWVPAPGTIVLPREPARPTAKNTNDGRGGGRKPAVIVQGSDEDLDALNEILAPLVERFGTSEAFSKWLASLKTIEDIRGKRIANDESEQSLISRELVRAHVFGLIDEVFRKLLADSPKTIARLVYAEAKAGRPVEDAETIARNQISAQIKSLKARAKKALDGGDGD